MKNWAKEHDAMLKELIPTGVSRSIIAIAINRKFGTAYTRNAVIGRAIRMGLGTPAPVHLRKERISSQATRHHRLRSKDKPGRYSSPLAGLPTSPLPAAQDYDVPRVSFADLEDHHCRFPVGEPTQGYCGHSKVNGLSYCEVHSRRCYTPATPRTERRRDFVISRIIGLPRALQDA